jgi:hypothetical protein
MCAIFPADDEDAAQEALDAHPRPGQVLGLVQMLIENVEADPARLRGVAAAARARYGELARQGEPPPRLHSYLVAAALASRGLAMIQDAPPGHPPGDAPEAGRGPARKKWRPVNGRRLAWVMRLPQIDPPFTEDQRRRDGCMMPALTWRQRALRQRAPRRGVQDCCHYHRQDFHAIAATVNAVHRQLRRSGLDGEDADELTFRLLREARLSEDERDTATLLLDDDCGIRIWRPAAQRRWTYQEGRHRARADGRRSPPHPRHRHRRPPFPGLTTAMIGKLRTVFAGSRGDSAGLMAYGIAALLAWLRFPYLALLIAGAVVTAGAAASLAANLRRGRAWHEHDVLLRRLWAAVKRIPPGYVLADPGTGELLSAERDKGWLTLAVTDPPEPGRASTVTRYMVGRWAAPNPPPLYRHMAAIDDLPPARWRLRQQAWLADFNTKTGALEVTTGEIADLLDQVNRAETPPH